MRVRTLIPALARSLPIPLVTVFHNPFQYTRRQGCRWLGDGTSWANAATDLAQALVSQASSSRVWVAGGTCSGLRRPSAFILPPNIPGLWRVRRRNPPGPRNPSSNHTILSGDLGVQGVDSDNAFHVVIPSSGSVLDGFVIKDGHASKNFSDDRGKGRWALGRFLHLYSAVIATFSNNRSVKVVPAPT